MKMRWASLGSRTRILKIGDQRLAREIGRSRPKIHKTTPLRLRDVSLTPGQVAHILANRTWPTETGLAGWGCRELWAKVGDGMKG